MSNPKAANAGVQEVDYTPVYPISDAEVLPAARIVAAQPGHDAAEVHSLLEALGILDRAKSLWHSGGPECQKQPSRK